jgi:hypothetical protein
LPTSVSRREEEMANELAFNTYLVTTVLTQQVVGTRIEFHGVGKGGGGAQPTGNVGENASGGGGGGAKVVKLSAEASYTLTPGTTGGAAGTDGSATDGADSTVSDTSGVILKAPGGKKGTAANPTATAGLGGNLAVGIGDVVTSGGDGTKGAANTAGNGGASGGTTSSASGTTPGAPNGAPGYNNATGAELGTGGPRQANAAALDAGNGWITAYFQRLLANLDFAYAVGIEFSRDTGNLSTRPVPLALPPDGSGHLPGDRLLIVAAVDGNSGSSVSGGTNRELLDSANATLLSLAMYGVDLTGSDSLAFDTAATEQVVLMAVRIRNAAAVALWDVTPAVIASAQMDAPSHTHTATASTNILWGAFGAYDPAGPTRITSFPAGFDRNLIRNPAAASSAAVGLVASFVAEAVATKNPGSWGSINKQAVVATLAIPSGRMVINAGIATGTSTALKPSVTKAASPGIAIGSAQALQVAVTKRVTPGIALSSEVALASKQVACGMATESSEALAPDVSKFARGNPMSRFVFAGQ